ncbi:MAG: diguanylate cyclase [Betaproteobacteria bacterium]|nr:diguanylate cyclase [Betaproteobacteria bacterium]
MTNATFPETAPEEAPASPAALSSGFFLLPQEDPAQAHRMQRFLLASCTSFVVLFLFYLYHLLGVMDRDALVHLTLATVLGNIGFYVLFRSGLNTRFSDPSLTLWMILFSTLVLLYAINAARGGRTSLLLVYLVPFLFGLFRLSMVQMLSIAAFFLAGYGWILSRDWMLMESRSALQMQILQWIVPAFVLCWFAVFASYVGSLRKRLAESHDRLEEVLARLQSLVSRDDLTGLHNRRHITDILDQERSRADRGGLPFCVFMMDLDHFKAVNGSFGHASGDEVLRNFAENAGQILRPTDFFARYGGEEFLLFSTQTGLEGAQRLAERLRAMIASTAFPGLPGGQQITVSIGIAEYRRGEAIQSALLRADAALYAAKQNGRNKVETAT